MDLPRGKWQWPGLKRNATSTCPHSDFLFKLVLVGDSGVGKSCLLLRFADDTFSESYITTIGVDFVTPMQRFRTITVDGKAVKLQIVSATQWDTAGQERFRTITSAYYRGSDGVMLVFDKTVGDSFDHIPSWMEEIGKYSETSARMLVGNKQDAAEKCQVDTAKALAYAETLGIPYVETSALSAHQVELAFIMLARELIRRKTASLLGKKGEHLGERKKVARKCCHK